ncbi:MAG: hypothetical protein M3Q31_12995 [Actinomycetota bacterium]|nr:hypothetical protein [Actinomycetota bacterium]
MPRGGSRRRREHGITLVWTDEEAEVVARLLENVDVYEPGHPLVDLKEQVYKITGRDFLLDADGHYTV